MHFKKLIHDIEASQEYKAWKAEHEKAYLAHAFVMTDPSGTTGEWQIGYFNPEDEKITTMIFKAGKVDINTDEVFKRPDDKVIPVNLDEVEVGYEQAKENAEELRKTDYSRELPTKIISVLQNLPDFGLIWNMTLVTQSLNTLNIKVDAVDGKIKDKKLTSLMEFRQK